MAGRFAYLPAIGRHEVLVVDTETWTEAARIPVAGQPVFVMARPDGRQVWVNFAPPDNAKVQVIETRRVRWCACWTGVRCCTGVHAARRSGLDIARTTIA